MEEMLIRLLHDNFKLFLSLNCVLTQTTYYFGTLWLALYPGCETLILCIYSFLVAFSVHSLLLPSPLSPSWLCVMMAHFPGKIDGPNWKTHQISLSECTLNLTSNTFNCFDGDTRPGSWDSVFGPDSCASVHTSVQVFAVKLQVRLIAERDWVLWHWFRLFYASCSSTI